MNKRFQDIISGADLINEFGTDEIVPAEVIEPTQELVKVEDNGAKSALHRYKKLKVDEADRFKTENIISLGEA